MPRSARALVVELVADVKEFVKGTQQADDALQDFVKDTESGVRDINRATDKLDDNIKDPFEKIGTSAKDAADDAERHFDNLAREAKTSFRKVEDAADKAAHDVGRESFGEAGAESGAEFAANLSETLSSGDFTGIGRDTAAGLVSGFAQMGGPIGLALAGVASGAAVLFAGIAKNAENAANTVRTVFEKSAAEAIEALDQSVRGSAFLEFLSQKGGGEMAKGIANITKEAAKAGISFQTVRDAYVAGGQPLADLLAKMDKVGASTNKAGQLGRAHKNSIAESRIAAQGLAGDLRKQNALIGTGLKQQAQMNSLLGDDHIATAVDQRSGSIRKQTEDLNSSARAAERARAALIDPRINIAIDERTRLLAAQDRQASETAAAVRGIPGTIVGGRSRL